MYNMHDMRDATVGMVWFCLQLCRKEVRFDLCCLRIFAIGASLHSLGTSSTLAHNVGTDWFKDNSNNDSNNNNNDNDSNTGSDEGDDDYDDDYDDGDDDYNVGDDSSEMVVIINNNGGFSVLFLSLLTNYILRKFVCNEKQNDPCTL